MRALLETLKRVPLEGKFDRVAGTPRKPVLSFRVASASFPGCTG